MLYPNDLEDKEGIFNPLYQQYEYTLPGCENNKLLKVELSSGLGPFR